ncbi:MAG: hypothetical protein ABSB49_06150 [Polyangia bacterium]
MRRMILISSLAALAVSLAALPALAQQGATPPASPTYTSTGTATFTSARSTHGLGLGLGAMTMLDGTSGLLVTWGWTGFHADGFAGLKHTPASPGIDSSTDFTLGGRFWYHIHAASFADFSLGGGVGINRVDTNVSVSLEAGGQIRAFLVPNVAIAADLGFGANFGNRDDLLIGAQSIGGGGNGFVAGTLGIAYFFE